MIIKIIVIIIILILITIGTTVVRIDIHDWSTRVNMILIISSIVGFGFLLSSYTPFEDNTEGFRTAQTSSAGWMFLAIPAAIIIGISELIARKFFDDNK